MIWQELQEYFKGKSFLIGLTFIDKNGDLIEQYQTHGTVSELTNEGLIRIKRKDGSVFQMPFDKDTIEEADEGEYRVRSTGEIIENPDFIMSWEITGDQNDLEETKTFGYIPAD